MPRSASAAAALFVLGALPLVTLAIGCAASPADSEADPQATASASVPKSEDLAPGELVFSERSAELLKGVYELEGTKIGFTIRREGPSRFFALATIGGRVLVESEYRDGVDTMRVLDGRAVQRGGVHEEGVIEGDPKALDELYAMPEAKLVAPLKDALTDAKVDPFFVGREAPAAGAAAGGLAPKAWYDGASWYLGYGEQASFATWSFWGWTTLSAQVLGGTPNGIRCLSVKAGLASPEHLCGSQSIQRQWGGMRLYVTYDLYLCPWSPIPSCNAGTYRVRTY